MAHGRPDWSANAQLSNLFGVNDMGELAARIGALSTYDRRGYVVWQYDCQDGTGPMVLTGTGTGNVQRGLWLGGLFGPACIQLQSGNANGNLASAYKNLPLPPASQLGLEVWLAPLSPTAGKARITIDIRNGSRQYLGRLEFNAATGQLGYYNASGTFTALSSAVQALWQGDVYHLFKVVVDYSALEYVRAILDNTEYSLADIPLWDAGVNTTYLLSVSATVQATDANAREMRVGGYVVTYLEP